MYFSLILVTGSFWNSLNFEIIDKRITNLDYKIATTQQARPAKKVGGAHAHDSDSCSRVHLTVWHWQVSTHCHATSESGDYFSSGILREPNLSTDYAHALCFIPSVVMLEWYMLSSCVHLSQAGFVSKQLHESSWFLAWRLPSAYPTLSCKETWVSPKIRVLPAGTGWLGSRVGG